MRASSVSRLVCLCSAVALVAAIALFTLGPAQWVPRMGLHWAVEHFLAFFAVTIIGCVAWPRPFLVTAVLVVLTGLLEALQGLTLDRYPNLLSALSGAGGVLTAALVVSLVIFVWKKVAPRRADAQACRKGVSLRRA